MNWYEQLTTLRRRAGLTQRAVAERIGAHPTSLIRWEAGAAVPQASDLCKLLSVLGATRAEKRQVLMGTLNKGPCEVRADDLARILTTLQASDRTINMIIAALSDVRDGR